MSIPKFLACACAVAFLWVGSAHAETWRWKDAEGQMHFGDRPPAGVQAERMQIKSTPSPMTDEDRARREAQLRADEAARDAEKARQQQRDDRNEADAAGRSAMNRGRCDRARWALAALDSGRPVYRDDNGAYRIKRPPTQPDIYTGSRQYLDEAEREREAARHLQDMARYCAEFPSLQDKALADEDLRHAEACEFAAVELEQLLQDEARATPEEVDRRRRFLDEECR